ncbi:hypothetical protein M1O24_02650, partial [Dehalococcoidia bacterium]|nr:hypothetical protein [Dehalococcoidia bacterium]
MLPESLEKNLKEHLRKIKRTHERDLSEGWGRVQMPDAVDRKYPNAPVDPPEFAVPSMCFQVEMGDLMPISLSYFSSV